MRLVRRGRPATDHRLGWQCASLLLSYPDADSLRMADEMLVHLDGPVAEGLSATAAALRELDPMRAAQLYVDTFDLKRRCTMYLTYWTDGDTRNRGNALLAFAQAYRAAGVEPPARELPDHLPVVLEFAATVDPDGGRRLLTGHRVPIEVLHRALAETASPYASTVAAVLSTLPPVTDAERQRAQRLATAGPPAEAVGLEPFTLTVPPRREET
ncbi:nitrate reductase molybdenum cofactor assembly chaperone [Mycolicibacterium thermoresistibile]|uniref:Respiratory nitrate reductase chaperone NarJ n=2 Tax=Mycolicibacterium thermoresistibile TaxID=1797 RepID=G7CGC5_MYCT3|nr:nitrate reductase molybdenum cofactor assembly chaperone [Mycolicibacterium thermoresistibile]EHI11885.1 respiratory nitrate reductase chaperone NarJ [Mycolicibacterium thermoresistibile ATCC 19527]MCV7187124.1 nitrate reductase molybdenum cofactor assembly chaperone [Mycolicibacterium thermoresistibile]GAT16097.1 respiratory nitrate reductase delta subunit narJ [Mycolicibacterium thermoresistibile]SNW19590.1 respiratory nitrate reductase chaperone NarJ [Mycolicibacterium thermoresistibile]